MSARRIPSLVAGDTSATTGVVISRWPSIDMTGYLISTLVLFRLARRGSNVLDTMAGDAPLIEFDAHYQIDAAGSVQEFVKEA